MRRVKSSAHAGSPSSVTSFQKYRTLIFNNLQPTRAAAPIPSALLFARKGTMVTEKQLEANRRNAQQSTGPRTIAAQANPSRNNLRHGLTGHISLLPTEDR